MRTSFGVVAVAAVLATVAGCQSHQQHTHWSQESRVISVDTQPQGAHVWQIAAPSGSRVDLGMTPIVNQQVAVMTKYQGSFSDMALAQNTMSSLNQVRLRIEKPGYQPYDLTMSPSPNQVEHRNVVLEPATPTAPATTQPAAPTTAAASASR